VTLRLTVQKHLGVDGRIILKWIFKTWDWAEWTGFSWLRIGTVGGLFVNAVNEPPGSIKCGEFLD
jgi:hypothetical protein